MLFQCVYTPQSLTTSFSFDADASKPVQAGYDLRSFKNEAIAASKHKLEEQGLAVASKRLRVEVPTEAPWGEVQKRGVKVHATEDKVRIAQYRSTLFCNCPDSSSCKHSISFAGRDVSHQASPCCAPVQVQPAPLFQPQLLTHCNTLMILLISKQKLNKQSKVCKI